MSENNGSSNNEFKPAPWEKETNSMDDKKNVSFVSGLALLLSVLALVMIGWAGIADSPSQEEYKELINTELNKVNNNINSIDEKVNKQANEFKMKKLNMSIYKLAMLNLKLDAMKAGCDAAYTKDITALQVGVQALMAKMKTAKDGKPVPGAKTETKDSKTDKGTKAEQKEVK